MAIFLSRIKRALNVGSKSITNNGTYYASADGYDGYDEVTVNVSGGSATPITPSNANPVALSSGVAVQPTANGYAIQSYDNITPPSSPQAISSGDILKMIGNGYVIDTYSTATPSDSTPPQLSQGGIYIPTSNGYLYENQQGGSTETVLWTNNSPTSSQSNGQITLSDNISNYEYLALKWRLGTSDDTTNTIFIKTTDLSTKGVSGSKNVAPSLYAYSGSGNAKARPIAYVDDTTLYIGGSQNVGATGATNSYAILLEVKGISVALPPSVGNVKVGATTVSTSDTKVTLGFKPKYICAVTQQAGGTAKISNIYNEDLSTTKAYVSTTNTSAGYITEYTIGTTGANKIKSIDNDGFTLSNWTPAWVGPCYYFAIG